MMKNPVSKVLAILACFGGLVWVSPSAAAEVFVQAGASAGDGSEASPFSTISEAIDASASGDSIVLLEGDYGAVTLAATGPLTFEVSGGAEATFSRVDIDGDDLTVRGFFVADEGGDYLMSVSGSGITLEDCVLQSHPDTADWTADDWIDRASSGISVGGSGHTIRNNYLKNVGYGISVGASNSLVEGNVVENFSRDGLRGLGDYTTFQYNVIKNCYNVDNHHDDGFQSWSVTDDGVGTGEVTGIVLRGNTFLSYEDPEQPHRGTLQGIGCFDGTFVDWVIENNVVVTDHWHGITLLGARGSVVVNNTVMDPNREDPGPPWIKIDNHKDGTPPEDCIVRNNLTTDLANADSVLEEGNIEISMDELDAHFVDPVGYDLHLLDSSSAIDAVLSDSAPEIDRDRISRPQGDAVDVGAYEWHDGSAEPVDGPLGPALGSGGADPTSTPSEGDSSNAVGDSAGNDGGCQCALGPVGHPRPWGVLLLGLVGMVSLARRSFRPPVP